MLMHARMNVLFGRRTHATPRKQAIEAAPIRQNDETRTPPLYWLYVLFGGKGMYVCVCAFVAGVAAVAAGGSGNAAVIHYRSV